MVYRLETDKHIYLKFHSPFAEKVLLTRCDGSEFISDLFRFDLEMVSPSPSLSFAEILGKDVTIEYDNGEQPRYFNGIVSEFRQGPTQLEKTGFQKTFYYATVVPRLWLATVTENCKIYQDKSTLDIVKKILQKHGVKFEDKVQGAGSEPLTFCVQYNESDFNFISRLMEKEGIFYFFQHKEGEHILILGNIDSAYSPCEHNKTIKYTGLYGDHNEFIYGISRLEISQQIVPSAASTNDFNFKMSKTLYAHTTHLESLGGDVYHYPGEYPRHNKSRGEEIARLRLQALDAPHTMMVGDSNVSFLMAGEYFILEDFPRGILNGESLILHEVTHFIKLEGDIVDESFFNDNDNASDILYRNTFRCLEKSIPFHPLLKTPQPKINSTQTAIVTGPEGEEIWTNEYGEIKVKFHWDLNPEDNDKTSCWIRVSQGWAGNNWGILFTPRIGQEVVVQFLNGNPDCPLITGCVYNSTHMPPYLPDEPTKSTIKSHSTKDGGPENYNEFRFEDKKGKEEVYLQAEKDLNELIKNDMTTKVIHNKTSTIVKGYEKKTLEDGDRFVTVNGDQTTHITGDMFITVDKNVVMEVGQNFTLLVRGNVMVNVEGMTDGNFQKDIIITNQMGGVTTTIQEGPIATTIMEGGITTTLMEGGITTTLEEGGIATTLMEGGITTTVMEGAIATTVTEGAITTTVMEGAITTTIMEGAIATTVTEGAITTTVVEGAIVTTVAEGDISVLSPIGAYTLVANAFTLTPVGASVIGCPKAPLKILGLKVKETVKG